MFYASNLYVDDESADILIEQKRKEDADESVYKLPLTCIYFPEESDRPEYCEIRYLKWRYYSRHNPTVIGFAIDADHANAILKDIIERTAKRDPNLDYRAYIEAESDIVSSFDDVKGFFLVTPSEDDIEDEE